MIYRNSLSVIVTSLIICVIAFIGRPFLSSFFSSFLVFAQSQGVSPQTYTSFDSVDIMELRRKAELYDELEKNYLIGSLQRDQRTYRPTPIILRPETTPYGTLVIGAGSKEGIQEKTQVYFDPETVYGVVDQIYNHSSRVVSYSYPDMKTKAYVRGNIPVMLVGQGSGTFEFTVPQQVSLTEGDLVYLSNNDIIAEVVQITNQGDTTLSKVLARNPYALSSFRYLLLQKE